MFERWVEGGLLSLLQEKRCRQYRLLTAGWRTVNRPLSERHSCGFSCGKHQSLSESGPDHSTKAGKSAGAECAGRTTRAKLSQMALAWVLRDDKVTSVLIGASKTAQIEDAVGMLANRHFTSEECAEIDAILS